MPAVGGGHEDPYGPEGRLLSSRPSSGEVRLLDICDGNASADLAQYVDEAFLHAASAGRLGRPTPPRSDGVARDPLDLPSPPTSPDMDTTDIQELLGKAHLPAHTESDFHVMARTALQNIGKEILGPRTPSAPAVGQLDQSRDPLAEEEEAEDRDRGMPIDEPEGQASEDESSIKSYDELEASAPTAGTLENTYGYGYGFETTMPCALDTVEGEKELPAPPSEDEWMQRESTADDCPMEASLSGTTGYSSAVRGIVEQEATAPTGPLRAILDSCDGIQARNLPHIVSARDSLAQEVDVLYSALVGSNLRGQPPRVNHTGLQVLPCQFPLYGTWYGSIKTPAEAFTYILAVTASEDRKTYQGTHSTSDASSEVVIVAEDYHVTIEDEYIVLEGSLDPNHGTIEGKLFSKAGENSFPFTLTLESDDDSEGAAAALAPKIDRSQLRREASLLARLHGVTLPRGATASPRATSGDAPKPAVLQKKRPTTASSVGSPARRRGSIDAYSVSSSRPSQSTSRPWASSRRRHESPSSVQHASPARHDNTRETYASFKSSVGRFPAAKPPAGSPRKGYPSPSTASSPPESRRACASPFRSTTERFPNTKARYAHEKQQPRDYVHPRSIEYGLKPIQSRVVMG